MWSRRLLTNMSFHQINDIQLLHLHEAPSFCKWYEETLTAKAKKAFISDKLWFDLNSMILGFLQLVYIKLEHFLGSVVKPCILNQDMVENHFCQIRAANGQNESPTYALWPRLLKNQ
jgi:hypothetical protein